MSNAGISIDEVIVNLFLALTPDGDEDEYFDIFDTYIKDNALQESDLNYQMAKRISVELMNYTIAQLAYSPAFEYIVRGYMVDIVINEDNVMLMLEYSVD